MRSLRHMLSMLRHGRRSICCCRHLLCSFHGHVRHRLQRHGWLLRLLRMLLTHHEAVDFIRVHTTLHKATAHLLVRRKQVPQCSLCGDEPLLGHVVFLVEGSQLSFEVLHLLDASLTSTTSTHPVGKSASVLSAHVRLRSFETFVPLLEVVEVDVVDVNPRRLHGRLGYWCARSVATVIEGTCACFFEKFVDDVHLLFVVFGV
mmetsp:Transcript_4187/g.9455  ORF Transcript_4187/g.9455 Transcript_4187/m.9455 type:complete len:203 (+) Transcript_4187:574-1182(+)